LFQPAFISPIRVSILLLLKVFFKSIPFVLLVDMKKILLLLLVVVLFFACKQERERPTDSLDTAREFIRSSLDGDFDWAKELMIQDSLNLYELGVIEKKYKTEMSEKDREGYKRSSIIVHSVDNVSDSVVIVNYSNSYKKKQMPVKVIRRNDIWQVDFNYTFTGNL
jgi:hypothetical protein